MISIFSDRKDVDYLDTVLKFLNNIEDDAVSGVVLVGITDNGPYVSWNCTTSDIGIASATLQAIFNKEYIGDAEVEDDGQN